MDISYLKSNFQKLFDHLKKNNYHKDACWLTKRCVNLVLTFGPTSESYEEIFWNEVKRRGYKSNEPRFKALRVYLGNVKRFHIERKLPDRKIHECLFPRTPVEAKLTKEYQELVHFYKEEHSKCQFISDKSIYTRTRVLIGFLSYLQDSNIISLNDISESSVLFFFHDGEKQKRGKDFCFLLKRALEFIKTYHQEEYVKDKVSNVIGWLPRIKSGEKPYPYLEKEEFEKIREVLLDEGNKLTHRDRLVGWILFFWGLRGTDIISLTIGNIDWRYEVVSLIQSKTGEYLSLPMNVHIGNELFDYLTMERSTAELEGPILRQQKSIDRSLGNAAGILSKIFKIAGIRQNGGGGLRLMRHNLVTTLLGRNAACEVVSSIVGHRSPESLKHYADSDIDHLRACALSIEDYPMPSNYFQSNPPIYGKTI